MFEHGWMEASHIHAQEKHPGMPKSLQTVQIFFAEFLKYSVCFTYPKTTVR